MSSIHQTASSLGQTQLLTLLSIATVIAFRRSVLKIMITVSIALVILLLLTGAVAVLQEFR